MNWDRNAEVFDASYEWGKQTIQRLLAGGQPGFGGHARIFERRVKTRRNRQHGP